MIHRHHTQVSIHSVYRIMSVFIMLTSNILRSVRSVCFPFIHTRFITVSFLILWSQIHVREYVAVISLRIYDWLCFNKYIFYFQILHFRKNLTFSYLGKCFTRFGSFSVIFFLLSIALRLKTMVYSRLVVQDLVSTCLEWNKHDINIIVYYTMKSYSKF